MLLSRAGHGPIAWAAASLVALGVLGFACSSESSDGQPTSGGAAGSAGASAAGSSGSSSSGGGPAGASAGGSGGAGSAGSGGAGGAECSAMPAGVPPCWERLEYPPGVGSCDVYYPGPKAEMPPPMVWDEVDLPTEPPLKARVMNRTTPEGDSDPGAFLYGWYDAANARVLLSFSRNVKPGLPRYRLLAEADGPVVNAALSIHPRNKTCEIGPTSFDAPYFVLNVIPAEDNTFEGAVLAPVGSKAAPTALHLPGARPSAFFVSDKYIVRWSNGVFVRSWNSDTETNVLPAFDTPTLLSNVFAREDAVFATVTGGAPGTQMWRETGGSVPFVRFDATSPRGASNLVTDGRDWVWTEGTRTSTGWANFELFTAPYSLDPAQVRATARRLHTEPTGWASSTFVPSVGCGYRARIHITDRYELHVTRLADGHRWIVRSPDTTQTPFVLGRTLAVSCDEVFVQAEPAMLTRIRLSDLGPGQAAD